METAARKMPLGIQDFEKLRNDDCVYVDKTRYVYELTRVSSPYFLSRPRRFGKSLLTSTFKSYNPQFDEFTLGFPNEEVKYGFLEDLLPAFAPQVIRDDSLTKNISYRTPPTTVD